jgi:hypothetical protein
MNWALRNARFCGTHFQCILINRGTSSQIEHQLLRNLKMASVRYRGSLTHFLQRKLSPSARRRKDRSTRCASFSQRLCAIPPGARSNSNKGWNDLLRASPRELRLSRICSITARSGIARPNLQGSYVYGSQTFCTQRDLIPISESKNLDRSCDCANGKARMRS